MIFVDILLVLLVIGGIYFIYTHNSNRLDKMSLKQTGNGQFGTAHWADHDELEATFKKVEYRPDLWRQGINLPTAQGLIIHCENEGEPYNGEKVKTTVGDKVKKIAGKVGNDAETPLYCYVDDGDVHTLMYGASGIGKTANFLYPNIEYACAAGMSFLTTDTKGDLYRNTGTIAEKYYGYEIKVIDLRNPLESSGYNMLYLVNKYMDLFKKTGKLAYQAKAEKYAKITSKTIIEAGTDPGSFGQNQYFYDSAEGIVTSIILIIAEYCGKGEKHIVSCFKLIQDLMTQTGEGETQFKMLIDLLPENCRARWFASSALDTAPETMQSVMSTAMSKLLSFLDAELEQILCFKNSLDVERFCNRKTAIYIVLPEEDTTKHFIASLMIQQIYREMLIVADAKGGKLDNRVMFYCDELGTMPKIDGLEAMFSAARSRKISIIAIVQSQAQLEQTYGKEGAEIIADNCQLTIFGGFAPNSKTAEQLSANLGKQTIENGSVTYGGESMFFKKAQSKTMNMVERPLMTVDELKNMPKGNFIVMKTGNNPFRVKLRLFLKWGIAFEELYKIPTKKQRQAVYADKNTLIDTIMKDSLMQVL